jgi:hypothetical protein
VRVSTSGNVDRTGFVIPFGGPQPVDVLTSKMEDGVGKDGPHKCVHRVVREVANAPDGSQKPALDNPPGYDLISGAGSDGARVLSYWKGALGNSADSFLSNGTLSGTTVNISYDEADIVSRLFKRADGLKADALLNVVEAHQIAPACRSVHGYLPALAANWARNVLRYRIGRKADVAKRFRAFARNSSGAFLAYKFGIAPLVADMISILKYAESVKRDLKRHANALPSRFSIVTNGSVSIPTVNTNEYGFNGYTAAASSINGSGTAEVRHVLVVKPTVKYSTGLFNSLDLVMDRFASSPASLVWEKIPFSFVLDWFVDVSGMLRYVDRAIGFEPYQVVSFTRSRKVTVERNVSIQYFRTDTGASITTGTHSLSCKEYTRDLVSGGSFAHWKPRFGKSQAAISAALITQALTSLRSRR